MKKCVANFETLHLSFKKKLNNKKINISSSLEKGFKGDENLVLKKQIVFKFEKVERKEITITNLAKLLKMLPNLVIYLV